MIKFALLLICIFFSLNLESDKEDAITLNEYEIECYIGKSTYKIENTHNRPYLVLIKASSLYYSLYEGDEIISYDNEVYNDYFFPLKGGKTLYLKVSTNTNLCFSYMFSDYNYIHLNNGEEYKHPIVNYETRIKTKIENVADKHFIFYVIDFYSPYTIELNGKSYRKLKYLEVTSMIPKENDMEVYLDMDNKIEVVTIKYVSRSYENITQNTSICIDNNDLKSYFINKAVNEYEYFMLTFNDNSQYELFKNTKPIKTEENEIYSLESSDYFFLPDLDSCFQLLFLNKGYIEIKSGLSFEIINSKKYHFDIINDDDSTDKIHLIINSTSNNFIRNLSINEQTKSLNKEYKNNYYLYNITFTPDPDRTYYYIDIFFDLNSKSYINVGFMVEIEKKIEEKDSHAGIIVIVVLIVLIPILCYVGRRFWIKYKEKKKEEYEDMKWRRSLLKEKNAEKKSSDFYSKIEVDINYINKICVLCCDLDNIIQNYDSKYYYSDKIDVIEDINNGTFENFYDYIFPKKCNHSFHDDCCKKQKKNKNTIKEPKNCNFCKLFLTCENFQKFGLFFSEKFITNVLMMKNNIKITVNERGRMIKEIEKIFYSKIEESYNIDNEKKEKLLKIRKLNQKYLNNYHLLACVKNFNYFTYYKTNLSTYTDSMMDDLNSEIDKVIEKRREERRQEEAEKKVLLKACYQCYENCIICCCNLRNEKTTSSHAIGVHRRCSSGNDLCFLCNENKGTKNYPKTCKECYFEGNRLCKKCYFCQKEFN